MLCANSCSVELNPKIEFERFGGRQRGRRITTLHPDTPLDSDAAAVAALVARPATFDQLEPAKRVAVEDRWLGAIEHDEKIVNARPKRRRHQMLDDADARAIFGNCCTKMRFADAIVSRWYLNAAHVFAAKDDPPAGLRRQ